MIQKYPWADFIRCQHISWIHEFMISWNSLKPCESNSSIWYFTIICTVFSEVGIFWTRTILLNYKPNMVKERRGRPKSTNRYLYKLVRNFVIENPLYSYGQLQKALIFRH